ncbi:LOW QUALITY PROTEIN: floricaula/leafy homolog [Chenopodium quinoa]|uniref:LOW QUALITY PROTEIN: floricaula/leafy homolog n=1 Tax=Chenopodium quinoa TaxID=63459 RepID=UPI000B78508A|nr:LOW QUALITY PROTEIN: floricaula/leafy homolog [Chenopodium quinoa]
MDQDPFTASLFKWDYPRSTLAAASAAGAPQQSTAQAATSTLPPYFARGLIGMREPPVGIPGVGGMGMGMGVGVGMSMQGFAMGIPGSVAAAANAGAGASSGSGGLEELFQAYGIRYYTAAKIAEMGFTVNTLVDMKEEEVDEMMNSLSHLFRWDLLVGERYGIKAAIRAERRRLEDLEESRRHRHNHMSLSNTPPPDSSHHPLDALSQEGLSEEGVHEKEVVGSGGGNWEMVGAPPTHTNHQDRQQRKKHRKQQHLQARNTVQNMMTLTTTNRKLVGQEPSRMIGNHHNNNSNIDDDLDEEEVDDDEDGGGGGGIGGVTERQREHPFIVTEPGEVARGKKNGLDYLFHLYEQCRDFLHQVQNIAKERGEKCPTKVTNQVFRFAKKAGATYINKPKMRHYVHCYALHCLDEETSNALRRAFKERGENVGAWRQACYKPLVAIAARQGWDIDAIFNSHPRLSIWYVPTKLRQLCHTERSSSNTSNSISAGAGPHHLPF